MVSGFPSADSISCQHPRCLLDICNTHNMQPPRSITVWRHCVHAASQTLPCDGHCTQSIPWTAGSCHCPREVFPTIQLLLSLHTSRCAAQPFLTLAAQHPSIVLRKLFPRKSCPRLPQHCSWCSSHPLAPPGNLPLARGEVLARKLHQITAAVGMWFQYFPLHPSSSSPGYSKHLFESEPLNRCCKRQHQWKHQLGLAALDPAAGCWAARNLLTPPTFHGQSKFGYDLPAARITGPKPPDSRASFQNDSEPTQLLSSLQPSSAAPLPWLASLRLTDSISPRSIAPLQQCWKVLTSPFGITPPTPQGCGCSSGDSPLHDDEQTLPPLVEVLIDIHDADDVRAL